MSRGGVAGIDPGKTGAIVALWCDGAMDVWSMPVMKAGARGRNTLDLVVLHDILHDLVNCEVAIVVEEQQAFPKQGAASTFATGYGYGALLGMLRALNATHCTVRPAAWKRALGVPAGKDGARLLASQVMPTGVEHWRYAKDHDKAEAALLAWYGATRMWVDRAAPRLALVTVEGG